MTVGELIAELGAFDLDIEVVYVSEGCTLDVETVEAGEYTNYSKGKGYYKVQAVYIKSKDES